MNSTANFKVDTKLAELLGETYRSLEEALKELVDNSYDADATVVDIQMPEEFDENPIVIVSDNGSGMTEKEIRNGYLNIASSRLSRKGDRSIDKNRKIKGRKGIGKFAGLMIANEMSVTSAANGQQTTLVINKGKLASVNYDLEKVPLPITSENCAMGDHGTQIVLSGLNQNYHYPNQDRMKEILVRDYGRERDFALSINGEVLSVLDLQGKSYEEEIILDDGRKAFLKYTISNKKVKGSGISVRVGNRIIGRPQKFLKKDDIIPDKLKGRIYGELVCDDLESDVTADHGAIIENSKLFQKLTIRATENLKKSVDEVFKTDMKMARARHRRRINSELAKLPEYKQPFAKKALYKTLEKFYGESDDRINTVIGVMISAMEKDHYWGIIQNIESTRNSDIEKFAESLNHFGLVEMSIFTSQAINRLKFLDEFELLIMDERTVESTVHKAIENNTWVLGDDYSVLISDTAMKSAIEKVFDKKYKGDKKQDRPDLLVGRRFDRRLVLVEFKRPSFTINRETERQALEYRDDLNVYTHNQAIEIILLGGKVKQNISSHNERADVLFRTYVDLIGRARTHLEWLLDELKKK
jgi:hypothetical protein